MDKREINSLRIKVIFEEKNLFQFEHQISAPFANKYNLTFIAIKFYM